MKTYRHRPIIKIINRQKEHYGLLDAFEDFSSALDISNSPIYSSHNPTIVMFDYSEDTYIKLKEANYEYSHFLELRGNLSASCPKNEICRDKFSQTGRDVKKSLSNIDKATAAKKQKDTKEWEQALEIALSLILEFKNKKSLNSLKSRWNEEWEKQVGRRRVLNLIFKRPIGFVCNS